MFRPRPLLAALLVVLAAACFESAEEAMWARGESVGRLMVERLSARDAPEVLRLGDLAPFRWERLYLFAPYTPPQVVTDSLGFAWPGAEASRIAQVDTATLMVFTAGREVIAATMHPRKYGDFAPALLGRGYTPAEATFRVTRTAERTPLFVEE
jgi:hypothetical protein